jgi:hypothetical protein
MQGRLEGFADNQGYPRYNEGIRALDCGSGVTISCDAEQCGVIVFTDSNGIVNKVFAAPLLIFARNVNDSECRAEMQSDNRLSDIGTHPYVQLYGYRADNTDAFKKPFLLSLFPENGQTAEELKTAIIAAICACTASSTVEPINGLRTIEEGLIGLGGTLIQDTTVSSGKAYSLAFIELLKFSVSADEIDVTTTGSMDLDAKNLNLKGSTKVSLSSTAKVIEIAQDNYLYFGDSGTDGSWRMVPLAGNFVTQKRELGIWVTKQTITP